MHSMMKQRCLLTKFYCTANKMTHETLSLVKNYGSLA